MARLSKEEWQAAQKRWENDSGITFEQIAADIGVSKAAASAYAKRNNWSRLNVDANVDNVDANVDSTIIENAGNGKITAKSTDCNVDANVDDTESNAETKLLARVGRPNSAQTILTQAIKERAAQYGYDAIAVMVDMMNDIETPANVRLAAAEKLLDRAYGKPKQEVEMSGEVSYVDKADLDARYQKNMAKTAEMALKTQERIELLKNGTLH